MVFFSFDHLCNGKWLFAKVRYSFIMPPVSRSGLGLSVHLSVCLSVTLCIRSRMVRDRILESNIWNVHENRDPYFFFFFFVGRFVAELYPCFDPFWTFCIINLWNLVNKIPGEPLS